MLADPISVKIGATATDHPRVTMGPTSASFKAELSGTRSTLEVKQNTTTNRFRREVRLMNQKVAADPVTAVNSDVGASVYLVIDEPRFGFTDAELLAIVQNLKTVLTDAFVGKILVGEY